MRKFLVSLASLVLVIAGAFVSAAPAEAAEGQWSTTSAVYNRVLVRYCDGTTGGINAGTTVTKNVCAFKAIYSYRYYVKVKETGTVLYNFRQCSSDRWITFNSMTDTSRTAVVATSYAGC